MHVDISRTRADRAFDSAAHRQQPGLAGRHRGLAERPRGAAHGARLMLVDFFLKLRACGVPVTLRELLDLLSALEARVIHGSIDDFYQLSRLCLVKDETQF